MVYSTETFRVIKFTIGKLFQYSLGGYYFDIIFIIQLYAN